MIFYLISIVIGCNLPMKSLTIYPTVGEFFAMPLQNIFNGNNVVYSCRIDCPKDVTLVNAMNPIYQHPLSKISLYSDFTTQAISSNNTHFVTLSNDSVDIHIFDFKTNIMIS